MYFRCLQSRHVVIQLGWDWGSTLFGAFDRCVCLVLVISLVIIAYSVNSALSTPLALSHARATHESANCASAPHRNMLARNGSSWHLHMSTSEQKRANRANIMMNLHHTIIMKNNNASTREWGSVDRVPVSTNGSKSPANHARM